ncbi:hypothetical protein PAPHI01_1032, partial [Pancytospora philotis]
QQLEQLVKHSYRVTEVLLHVQVNNVNAKGFYTGRGYALLSTVEDYYEGISPRAAYLFRKAI